MSRARSRTCHGKVRYRDKQQALNALRRVQRTSQREKQPVRVYFHAECHGWHATSRESWS